MQKHNTLDTTGLEADIATAGLDVEVFDLEGDGDLDFLLGDRNDPPRIFANRLVEDGTLVFRDVSHAVLPPPTGRPAEGTTSRSSATSTATATWTSTV